MFKAQDIHSVFLKYIDISGKVNKGDELQVKLLDVIYEFLTLLILNNAYNKSVLKVKFKQVMHHLSMNIACCDFLREIFVNNKDLLYNESLVRSLVVNVANNVNSLGVKDYYKAKLLDVLRVIQYDNCQTISSTQQLTLSILFNKKYTANSMFIFLKVEQQRSLWNEQEYEQHY